MTTKEKCEFLAQQNGAVGRNKRLGMEGITPLDNPRGGDDYYRLPEEICTSKYHPVCFPSMTNLGMSWNREAAEEVGRLMGKECKGREDVVRWLFRPGMNIKRSPLCGRNFEYISEDPVLTGQIAGHFIRGLQSEHVAACAKHYCVNHQECRRMTVNAVVSERALQEIYLKAFEEAFEVEKPWSVMTSYNKVNGSWVNSSRSLMNYLREDLQYDGVVVSDWAAVHDDKVAAHLCGMDVETAPSDCHSEILEKAVESGEIQPEVLDKSIERVERLIEKTKAAAFEEVDMEALHERSVDLAADSITLLKNRDHCLPLTLDENVLVVGQLAKRPVVMGYGSGGMNGYRIESPWECMWSGWKGKITFAQGYEQSETAPAEYRENEELIREALEAAEQADKIVVFSGYSYSHESEGRDRQDIELPKTHRDLLETMLSTGKPVVLVLTAGAAVDISQFADRLAAVLFAGYAGEGYGRAAADILKGGREPGGRLAETFPMNLEETPAYLSFAAEGEDYPNAYYGEDIFVGYRYYDKKKFDVLYPFGYGLSYTDFQYSVTDLSVSEGKIVSKVEVINIGKRKGSTVVQLYIGKKDSGVKRAVYELKAFSKVYLGAGECQTVTLTVPIHKLKIYSESQKKWILEKGTYQVYFGTSVRDLFAEKEVSIDSSDRVFIYSRMTPLFDFIRNPAFMRMIAAEAPGALPLLDQKTNPHLPLIWSLPIYRLSEPIAGPQIFTEEMIDQIVEFCNHSE